MFSCYVTTFLEYLLVHNIQQSKFFVVQTLSQIAELQNYWGFRGSQYLKQISGAHRWILNNKMVSVWGLLDWPNFGCCLQSWDSGLSWWIMSYRSQDIRIWNLFGEPHQFWSKKISFDSHHISDDVDLSMVLSFVYESGRVLLRGHFVGSFFGSFWGHFGGNFWGWRQRGKKLTKSTGTTSSLKN